MLVTETPKIKSTADPLRKMSKSAGEKHNISIFAEEARMRKQIKSAVTDTGDNTDGTMSAGVQNLFELLKAAENKQGYDTMMQAFNAGELQYGVLKQEVADTMVTLSQKFVERKKEITSDKRAIKDQIKQSSHEIRKRAQQTVKEVKELCGLSNVKF